MRQLHGDGSALSSEGGLHVNSPVIRPGAFILSVKRGKVMVAGLHRPDLVPLRGEGLSSITLNANVRKYRLPILVERQASRVVVIVVVVIVTSLDGEGCAVCFPKR